MMDKKIFLAVFIFLLIGCKTDEGDVLIEDTPSIELVSTTPSSGNVQQYIDELVFKIKYHDGDGDLGTDDPDIPSIELIDMRDPDILVFEYHLSPRAPSGAVLTISGELEVVLSHTIILDDNNDSEMTTFKIRIKDRAGNWSNEVESSAITISK